MGPLLQQSLDFADLLPTFVVEVGDEFDLDDTAISLVPSSGALVRAFSLGASGSTPLLEPVALGVVGDRVPAHGEVAIPLQRGGRVIGALTARARSGLDRSQVETLGGTVQVSHYYSPQQDATTLPTTVTAPAVAAPTVPLGLTPAVGFGGGFSGFGGGFGTGSVGPQIVGIRT